MSLPLLALTPGDAPAPKRQKTDNVYFKAFKEGPFRQLSNLFGPVEWRFQAVKFKEGSEVREWLLAGADKKWSKMEFDAVRESMQHNGKLKSYVDKDDTVASGLLAQMCSLIARNPSNLDARKRLAFILQQETVLKPADAEAWNREHVKPELSDEEKDELMLKLLHEKFAIPAYRLLLLRTEDCILHEAKGRGAPNRYEFHPLNDAQRHENENLLAKGSTAKWFEGGDVLGKLMMQERRGLGMQA